MTFAIVVASFVGYILLVVLHVAGSHWATSLFLLTLKSTWGRLHLWTLITYVFFPHQLIDFVFSAVILIGMGKVLEPVWGMKEYMKVCLLATLSGAVFDGVIRFLAWNLMGVFYEANGGCFAILGGLSVGLKQLVPEYALEPLPGLSLRMKWLPAFLLALTWILCMLERSPLDLFLIIPGFAVTYIYLRLFQPRLDGQIIGDASDEFALSSFFPEEMQVRLPAWASFSSNKSSTAASTVLPMTHGGAAAVQVESDPSFNPSLSASQRMQLGRQAVAANQSGDVEV